MKVKMKADTVFKGKVRRNGEEYDVDKGTAQRWIKRGIAEEVPTKSTPKKETKKTGDQ